MACRFTLAYETEGDFRAHLLEADARGVVLVPTSLALEGWNAFDRIDADVVAGDLRAAVTLEVVQVLPGAGLVVRVSERSIEPARLGAKNGPAAPPRLLAGEVTHDEPEPELLGGDEARDVGEQDEGGPEGETGRAGGPAGSSAISWPIEKLQAEWESLGPAEKIRVARYGNRGARGVVLRGRDKTLLVHLLGNPNISVDEVAGLAGTATLDPAALRRIAANRDWMRSSEVVRNLASHPKMPMPEVERMLGTMSRDELVRLTKSNRTRAIVKQAAMRRLKSKTK